jgi:hypothetical protein
VGVGFVVSKTTFIAWSERRRAVWLDCGDLHAMHSEFLNDLIVLTAPARRTRADHRNSGLLITWFSIHNSELQNKSPEIKLIYAMLF